MLGQSPVMTFAQQKARFINYLVICSLTFVLIRAIIQVSRRLQIVFIRLTREEKTMVKAERPFLIVNPKSYLYGAESLALAKSVDKIGRAHV